MGAVKRVRRMRRTGGCEWPPWSVCERATRVKQTDLSEQIWAILSRT